MSTKIYLKKVRCSVKVRFDKTKTYEKEDLHVQDHDHFLCSEKFKINYKKRENRVKSLEIK